MAERSPCPGFTPAKPDKDEIGCQRLKSLATIETSDDIDRRSLGNRLADHLARQLSAL